jgi:hypothetical protein
LPARMSYTLKMQAVYFSELLVSVY